MDVTTVVLGVAMLAYGLYGLALYMLGKAEQKFKKLAPMRQKWGTKAGTAIHCFSYVILPIVAGSVFVAAGLSGYSVFGA